MSVPARRPPAGFLHYLPPDVSTSLNPGPYIPRLPLLWEREGWVIDLLWSRNSVGENHPSQRADRHIRKIPLTACYCCWDEWKETCSGGKKKKIPDLTQVFLPHGPGVGLKGSNVNMNRKKNWRGTWIWLGLYVQKSDKWTSLNFTITRSLDPDFSDPVIV